jgi:dolichol-phosphate hexosyltransferase
MSSEICIILPTLNEEKAIGRVIEEIPVRTLNTLGYKVEVLVVDGISTDRTVQIAREMGARIIQEPRRGKGRAVRTALEGIKADFIFMLDGDYTYPSSYIPAMLEVLQKHPVVIGSRLRGNREKGAMRRFNLFGNNLLTNLANLLYRTRISDLCTGYWGFRRDAIENINLTSNGFQIEAELLIKTAKKGYKIAEIPIDYRLRKGKAKLSGFKDGFKIGWLLVSNRFHN